MARKDAFAALPDEILNAIIGLLPASSLQIVLSVSRRLYRIASDEAHWRRRTYLDYKLTFKPPNLTWRRNYYLNHSETCPHLNLLADPAYTSHFHAHWRALFASVPARQAPKLTCTQCSLSFVDLWMCMSGKCYVLGCSRTRNRHALQHVIQNHKPGGISIKLNTLEMWCHSCKKWLGSSKGPRDEREFLVDWQYRLLLASADLPCCSNPVSNQPEPTLLASPTGYPLPPPYSLWHAVLWNERRQWERDIPYQLDETPFCFVSIEWMQSWNEFLLGNTPPPGPVNNNALITSVQSYDEDGTLSITYELLSSVRPNIHFLIISTGEWKLIEQSYGGGPHLSESDLNATKHAQLIAHVTSLREQLEQGAHLHDDDDSDDSDEGEDEEHQLDVEDDEDEDDEDEDDDDDDDNEDDDSENGIGVEMVMIL
ncbi:hypothetical protein BDF22DRAFT_667659 [Syncephalis plumigaleata]|nr:hypothetical protein BDF22DRAFT_667659 [Syncephalis plumigaleata]